MINSDVTEVSNFFLRYYLLNHYRPTVEDNTDRSSALLEAGIVALVVMIMAIMIIR